MKCFVLAPTLTAVLLLSLVASSLAQDDAESCNDTADGSCRNDDESATCGLFLAESTIPGAGLGIFVGHDMAPGDAVGPGDIAIPIVDVSWHLDTQDYFSPFADYQWEGGVMGMAQDTDDADIEAFCPGLDCAINCHLALINVGKSVPLWDEAGLHRYTSPGTGAISPYHNGTTRVLEFVPKGGELFKFYGDWWFESRPRTFGLIPLRQHHTAAEQLCQNFHSLTEGMTTSMGRDLWTLVNSVPWESRTSNALPRTYENAVQAATDGIRSLYQPSALKSIAELQATGRCLDHIRHGPSTIPHAGRGAFATRHLNRGQVLTGSPLLHIPDRENFITMYKIEPDPNNPSGRWKRNLREKVGDQLLLNYCWGHDESTMLLCPYGVGVSYINHNQTRANVKIVWAKDGELSHNSSILNMDPLELMGSYKVQLAFDYIVTRDIEEGEEIFLDYGDAWEEAWTEHVKKWKPSDEWKNYAPAEVWNEQLANSIIRTKAEQTLDPYPSNILVRAHPLLQRVHWKNIFQDFDGWSITEKGLYCVVRNRRHEGDTIVYDVAIDIYGDDNNFMHTLEREGVPRNALSFVDVPYSTDFHQSGVFRHELVLPDEMMSQAWRNL